MSEGGAHKKRPDTPPMGTRPPLSSDSSSGQASSGNEASPRSAIPYGEWHYLRSNTVYPEAMIHHWYTMIAAQTTGEKVSVSTKKIKDLLVRHYNDKGGFLLNLMWNFSHGSLGYVKFRKFMVAMNEVSKKKDLIELRLDLTAFMCRDIDDEKGRVHKDKLPKFLAEVGQLTARQNQKVLEDINEIFKSLKDYTTEEGILDFDFFRYGLKVSYAKIEDPASMVPNKYHVCTCVSELTTAILALTSFAATPMELIDFRKLPEKRPSVDKSTQARESSDKSTQATAAGGASCSSD